MEVGSSALLHYTHCLQAAYPDQYCVKDKEAHLAEIWLSKYDRATGYTSCV